MATAVATVVITAVATTVATAVATAVATPVTTPMATLVTTPMATPMATPDGYPASYCRGYSWLLLGYYQHFVGALPGQNADFQLVILWRGSLCGLGVCFFSDENTLKMRVHHNRCSVGPLLHLAGVLDAALSFELLHALCFFQYPMHRTLAR